MNPDRIRHYQGTHLEVGISIGKQIGNRYPQYVDEYISTMSHKHCINKNKLEKESMLWFDTLPDCYKEEFEGISIGAGYPIEKLAQFSYCDKCIDGGCTSFICMVDGNAWIGRNNDFVYLSTWGYVNILNVTNKIPVMLFGMEGDNFSGTGINREKVWLHYNWLPIWDKPSFYENPISPFVFLRIALESCRTLKEIDALLKSTTLDDGMNLFAVDGKTNEFAVYECNSRSYLKREVSGNFIAGANHHCCTAIPGNIRFNSKNSMSRQETMEFLLSECKFNNLPDDFVRILSHPNVEQNNEFSGTVYSNVCCPGKGEIWYACGEFPSASRGTWGKVEWEW